MLKIIPLGGLGEIGLNMMVLESENSLVVVDAGLMFPEDYMLGVDYVIPDMDYIRENRTRVAGIVITHAHEDHIGAVPYLLRDVNVPVYATPFTLGMLRHKLDEHGLLEAVSLVPIGPDRYPWSRLARTASCNCRRSSLTLSVSITAWWMAWGLPVRRRRE